MRSNTSAGDAREPGPTHARPPSVLEVLRQLNTVGHPAVGAGSVRRMSNRRWLHVLASLAIGGCGGSEETKPAEPVRTDRPTTDTPAPTASSSPTAPRTLPPHTRVVDPDLLYGLCVLPQFFDYLKCQRTEPAVAVLRARETQRRYPWIALGCEQPARPKEVVKLVKDMVTSRAKYWNVMAPTTHCGAPRQFLITLVFPASNDGAVVVSGTSEGVAAEKVGAGSELSAPFQRGIQTIEKQLGVTLDLVTIRESWTSGAPGIGETFWPLDEKQFSDL